MAFVWQKSVLIPAAQYVPDGAGGYRLAPGMVDVTSEFEAAANVAGATLDPTRLRAANCGVETMPSNGATCPDGSPIAPGTTGRHYDWRFASAVPRAGFSHMPAACGMPERYACCNMETSAVALVVVVVQT